MSAHSSAGDAPAASARTSRRAEARVEDHGHGWVTFAGVMLAIVGTLNVVYGFAAIDSANVYAGDQRYVFGDLNMWGWFLVFVGAVQIVTAFGIWSGAEWARWVGVLSAGCNAIIQLLFLPSFPLLSVSLFAIDVLVIYALVQYGGARRAA